MEALVAFACLGGGVVTILITLVLAMRLQSKTPNPDETAPAMERQPLPDDR